MTEQAQLRYIQFHPDEVNPDKDDPTETKQNSKEPHQENQKRLNWRQKQRFANKQKKRKEQEWSNTIKKQNQLISLLHHQAISHVKHIILSHYGFVVNPTLTTSQTHIMHYVTCCAGSTSEDPPTQPSMTSVNLTRSYQKPRTPSRPWNVIHPYSLLHY